MVSLESWLDIPCFFSTSRAQANAGLLRQVLKTRFLERRSAAHPLRKLWDQEGIDAYLRLNALAEDLRLLTAKQGLRTLVNDLRSMGQWEFAHHTVHMAALLKRVMDQLLEPLAGRPQSYDIVLVIKDATVQLDPLAAAARSSAMMRRERRLRTDRIIHSGCKNNCRPN